MFGYRDAKSTSATFSCLPATGGMTHAACNSGRSSIHDVGAFNSVCLPINPLKYRDTLCVLPNCTPHTCCIARWYAVQFNLSSMSRSNVVSTKQ